MFDRKFLEVPRVMDDGRIYLEKNDILSICDNADEAGLVEGTSTIFMKGGLAFGVNLPVEEVIARIKALEVVQ